jgi:hypothetical protein
MTTFSVLFVIVFCIFASLFLFGMILFKIEKDTHGIKPRYRGWKVDENDEDQGDGKK